MHLAFIFFLFVYSTINIVYGEIEKLGHVVLITSPLYGHMIPLLDFAKCLSEHHYVTYIVSKSKLDTLKKYASVDDNHNSRLKFIGLIDGNDDDYQVTNTVSNVPIQTILQRMHEPLQKLLFSKSSTLTPINLIITDLFVLPPVWESHKRNISNYIFIPNSLLSFIRYINITMDKIKNGKLVSDFDSYVNETLSLANGLIFNSIFELDKRILDVFRQETALPGSKMPILFVAPLMSASLNQDVVIKYWLDTHWEKANRSPCVIYIAFGSWVSIELKQLIKITNALKPYIFIWSLKSKFQAFISSLGIDSQRHLLLDWAPQRTILSHSAIRLFISHGGWNSLLEGMLVGKPILVWPQFADQIVNGYRIEHEFVIGRCIQNAQKIVTTNEITLYLKGMFVREMEYFEKARQIQQVIFDAKINSSRIYFEEIIKIINKQLTTLNTNKKYHEL